jgi:hypothetical protein
MTMARQCNRRTIRPLAGDMLQFDIMQARTITLPELGLIASTRVALGAGIGLLLAGRVTRRQRKAVGLALIGFGAITTIPLLMEVLGKRPVIE